MTAPDTPDLARTPVSRISDAAPITAKQRIQAIDVVRGFALLGILVPNIVAFGWPMAAMSDPGVIDAQLGDNPWNQTGHDITSIFFLGKMMALFSMLFGAGVVIYARKFDGDGEGITYACARCRYDLTGLAPDGSRATCPECGRDQQVPRRLPLTIGASLWYRRIAWLLAIGFVHAVFLWFGDILVWYAVAGLMAVWWVRRWNPKLQIGMGLGLHLLSTLIFTGAMLAGVLAVKSGNIEPENLTEDPTREFAGYAGGYLLALKTRAISLIFLWIMGALFMPAVTGLMMIGMGLTRMGVLTAERPTKLYAWMAGLGLIGGLGLTATLYLGLQSYWPDYGGFVWQGFSQFVGIPISLGYMGLLIWLVRIDVLSWATGLLANVGRMALSNYLLHTLLCTTFFYGYGFGYFGKIGYPGLFAVVAVVWTVNLVFSACWLRFFRFGPAEWAWRSLTYWKLQPLRK